MYRKLSYREVMSIKKHAEEATITPDNNELVPVQQTIQNDAELMNRVFALEQRVSDIESKLALTDARLTFVENPTRERSR